MQGWGLLVWAAAYLSLKETAGDTVSGGDGSQLGVWEGL